MTRNSTHYVRILSVQPVSRGFGFAVLEGSSHLVDYGVVQLRKYTEKECLDRVAKIITRSQPSLILVEDLRHPARRSARASTLVRDIESLARKEQISHKRSTTAPRRESKLTKHEMATMVAERFPELWPRLPIKRKAWMSADARMGMFVACASALTYFSHGL